MLGIHLVEENVTQITGGITINLDVSKNIMYVKKIFFGILFNLVVKMENLLQELRINLYVMKLQTYKKRILMKKFNF